MIKKYILVFMQNTLCSFQTVVTLEFSQQIYEQYSNIQFHKALTIGSRGVTCGQTNGRTDRRTDRYDEANTRFLQFC
jgi:hypothetical protein